MTNWCQNIAYLTAPDHRNAVAFIASAANEELNKDFGIEDRYAPMLGGNGIHYVKLDGDQVEIASISRNDPPIELFQAMEAQGWKVDATYWEPDNCFWGIYRDGVDNRQEYELDEGSDEIGSLPAEVLKQFSPAVSEFARGWTALTFFN